MGCRSSPIIKALPFVYRRAGINSRIQQALTDSKSSEGVVIFTGIRVSASSLKCTTQPVRTRSSRLGILGYGQNRSGLNAVLRWGFSSLAIVASLCCHPRADLDRRCPGPGHAAVLRGSGTTGPVPDPGHRQPAHPQRVASLRDCSAAQGDPYDPAVVERDFNSLWNTGYFENVRIEKVDTPGLRAAR